MKFAKSSVCILAWRSSDPSYGLRKLRNLTRRDDSDREYTGGKQLTAQTGLRNSLKKIGWLVSWKLFKFPKREDVLPRPLILSWVGFLLHVSVLKGSTGQKTFAVPLLLSYF